jgi:hypothetical protein
MAGPASHTIYSPAPHRDFSSGYAIACEALDKGRCLEIGYDTFTRIVEVHRVGVSRAGEHILSGWQIRGPANERVGWKLLNLDEPVTLTLTNIPSQAPRPDYRRGAKQFIGIICQL